VRRRRGFTLIETTVALALLGVCVISILSAFSAITLAVTRHQQQTMLDLLARSDAESIKSQSYLVKPAGYAHISQGGYSFSASYLYYAPGAGFSSANPDNGVQEIVLTVTAPAGGTERLILMKARP
jgi:prepilin-type N-terminal cleavage/methylation domain-containing protein